MLRRATWYAVLAALLYAANLPFAKVLLQGAGPLMLAALLYLGAGLGMAGVRLMPAMRQQDGPPLSRRDLPYVIGMVVLDIAAPILMLLGLQTTDPRSASLLNSFEIVATSLIALLRAASYGWREEQLAENAQKISDLGQDLYKRLATLSKHLKAIGDAIARCVENYNNAVGSLERNVLPGARRFKELGAGNSGGEIVELQPLDNVPRMLQAPELVEQKEAVEPPALTAERHT